ncbi:uncharacterized protein LOC113276143 isoform X2 [Papaver somniferum]|uniref:uncharacterized protein LOC113276143 isoform X2 n=1 Tax=Papaver somniferum TaxID=3469 RepID=UPI000E7034AE|nr:uncharacterized protein LOC113276143 isoform X2 [Papaver somniferum]
MAKPNSTFESTNHTIFIDTNLNTHLVLIITNNDTVFDLKQKIMSEHPRCFPMHGKIEVKAIKARRKKCFYHVSDSMFVKSVFDRVNRTWFLYVDAVSEVVSGKNPLYLQPGSSGLPKLMLDGPSAEKEKANIQVEHQCIKVSGFESNIGIANHVILNDGQLVQGDMGGKVSNKLDVGVEILSSELIKSSDDTKERFISEKRKRCDPISTENEVPEIHAEHEKDEYINVKGGMDENILGEAPLLNSPAKKKQRKVKTSEDVSKNVKGPSEEAWLPVPAVKNDKIFDALHDPIGESMKETDAETRLHSKEAFVPENLLNEKSLGDEQQVTIGLLVKPAESLASGKRTIKKKSSSFQIEATSPIDTENEVLQMLNEHNKGGLVHSFDDPVGESMKVIDAGTPNEVASKPENLIHEKPLGDDEQQVTTAGLPITLGESLVREKRKKNKKSASAQNEVSKVDTKTEVLQLHNEHKIDGFIDSLHDPVEESMKEIDAGTPDKVTSKRENLVRDKLLEDELQVTSAGLPIKWGENLVREKGKKKSKSASVRNEVSTADTKHEVPEIHIEHKKDEFINSLHDPDEENMKEIDAGTPLHKDISKPENFLLDKPLGDEQQVTRSAVKPVESLVSEKRKRKLASFREVNCVATPSEEINLKHKLLDASVDTVTKDIANTRKKKKRTTKTSDAETCLPSAGAENDDSTRDIVPVTSEPEKALDTRKAGKSLPPTGKSRTSKKRTSDKDCGIGDNTFVMESLKTKHSNSKNYAELPEEQKVGLFRHITPSTDENRKQENTPLKRVKKSRIGKAKSDSNSSRYVPEVGKSGGIAIDSLFQVSENYESLQMPPDILEHDVGNRPLEENYESDVNGSTNAGTKSSAVEGDDIDFSEYFLPKDHQKFVAPAKGTEIKPSDKSLKVGSGENLLHTKNSDGGASGAVPVLKGGQNNPAPQPNMKATVKVGETPVEVSKKKVVSASGNATPVMKKVVSASANATPVISHLDRSSRVNLAQKKINVSLAESSSNTESTVDRVNKNEGGGVVPQSHAKVRIPLSDQIGKVLNASSSQRSLLSSVKPIFKESSGESSQDEGDEVNNSEASTQTPSDSSSSGSSTGEDSPGPSGGRRMDSDVTTPKCKEKISLDSIFKRSKSYKKARDIASQSQAEDPAPDIVLDSQV